MSLGRWYNNSIDSWRWNVIYIWAFQHHQHVSLLCSHSVIYSVIIMVSWFSSGTSQWLLVFSSNPSYPNHQEQFYVQLMITDQCWSSQLHHQDQCWSYVRHSHQLLIIQALYLEPRSQDQQLLARVISFQFVVVIPYMHCSFLLNWCSQS